jgi:hypothetical protein
MAKTLLSMHDLRRRALAEIRQQDGCHNVEDIAINRVTDALAENNWSLCVLSAGAADANTAARAALHVQSVLRRDYDLMTDLIARNRGGVMIDQLTEHDRIELLARAQEAWDRAPQNTMRAVFEWRGRTTSSPTRRFSCAFTLRKASRSPELMSFDFQSGLPE